MAALAGVSLQAAHRMLAVSPRLADLAAATDTITVIRLIPVPCPHCGQPFLLDDRRRYCRTACKEAAEARRHSARQRSLGLDMPRQPPDAVAAVVAGEPGTGGPAGFGNSATVSPATIGKYGLWPQTFIAGTVIVLDSALANGLYAAIGAAQLRPYVQGQDDVGHAALAN